MYYGGNLGTAESRAILHSISHRSVTLVVDNTTTECNTVVASMVLTKSTTKIDIYIADAHVIGINCYVGNSASAGFGRLCNKLAKTVTPLSPLKF